MRELSVVRWLVVPLAATAGCVGSTAPPPAEATTTLTAADVRAGEPVDPNDREAVLARARRRLEIATRELGVLERQSASEPAARQERVRELLRRADEKRSELEVELTRLAGAPSSRWSPLRSALSADLAELESLLDQARR